MIKHMKGEREYPDQRGLPDGKRIEVCKNGPYRVIGGVHLSVERITLDDAGFSESWKEDKNYPVEDPYILCRCG